MVVCCRHTTSLSPSCGIGLDPGAEDSLKLGHADVVLLPVLQQARMSVDATSEQPAWLSQIKDICVGFMQPTKQSGLNILGQAQATNITCQSLNDC